MRSFSAWLLASLFVLAALSGCNDKKSSDGGGGGDGEPDPSTFGDTTYDRAFANDAFRVTGSVAGPAAPAGDGSGVALDIRDLDTSDAGGASDKATFVLDIREDGFTVRATLREMATASSVGATGDWFGGVAQNVDVFGSSGVGPQALPKTKAFLFAAGKAQLEINGQAQSTLQLVLVAVTEGLRDTSQTALTAPDPTDLQFHVVFPGPLVGNNPPIPGVADQFLYYYFDTVAVEQLDDDEKANVGSSLRAPQAQNEVPDARGEILVDGEVASSAMRESDANVTVTFDGSRSTDPDGQIAVYVWKVAELNATGVYQPAPVAVVTGETATYNFTSPGPKLVELVVRDSGGAVDNLTLFFFVNQHRVIRSMDTNLQANTVSGFTDCKPAVNCFDYPTSFSAGIQSATYSFVDNQSVQVAGVHLELYAPGATLPDPPLVNGDDPVAEVADAEAGNDLVVPGTAIEEIGPSYKIAVWWQAGVDVSYHVDVVHIYAPTIA